MVLVRGISQPYVKSILTFTVIYHRAGNPMVPADKYMVTPAAIPVLKASFAMTQLVTPAFAFTRFSILALFLRIFRRQYVRRVSYFLIGFVAIQVLAYNITAAVQCLPTTYYWNRLYYGMYGGPGHCVNLDRFYISFQAPEMFVDLAIIILPLPEIWRLRSSTSRKLGLTALFLTGIIAFVANCFRQVIFIRNPVTAFTARMLNNTQSWIVVEPSICFIAACLPAMHPLATRLVPWTIKARFTADPVPAMKMRSHTPNSSTGSEGLRRLVDLEERAESSASLTRPHLTGFHEAKAARTGVSNEFENNAFPSVPLEDWRQVKYGRGVLMRQEVTVEQEDLIEDVLGF